VLLPPAVSLPASTILKRNNVRLFGTGDSVIMLCNGFGCDQHIWSRLTAALATRYRLVVFDYVGSGGSDLTAYTPERYATLAGYVQDVVDICQALQLRDVILVGIPLGPALRSWLRLLPPLTSAT